MGDNTSTIKTGQPNSLKTPVSNPHYNESEQVCTFPPNYASEYLGESTDYPQSIATFEANPLLMTSTAPTSTAKVKTEDAPKTRDQIPNELKWDLNSLYSSREVWERTCKKIETAIKALPALKKTTTLTGNDLLNTIERFFGVDKELRRAYAYGHMVADQDKSDPKGIAMESKVSSIMKDFKAATAFLAPTIQSLGEATLKDFIAKTPRLKEYAYFLERIMKDIPHTLSGPQEKIIASYSQIAEHPMSTFDAFNYGDMPFTKVTLSNGKEVKVSQQAYGKYRGSDNREDRVKIFESFWNSYKKFENTYASLLAGQVMGNITTAKLHNYEGPLEAALNETKVDPKVYTAMIDGIHSALPALHRYLKLRKKLLGVDELRYHDLYPSMIAGTKSEYTIPEGKKAILESVAVLGEQYVEDIEKGMNGRWADFMPTEGKRGGGYMEGGAYDVHPFVLLNWNGSYDSVSTTAHEFGHAMHTVLTNRNQPYQYSDYPIFLAEVPSTFNEILLARKSLENADNNKERLAILGEMLEGIRTTVFRQAQFAEFEKKIYDMSWNGESLTADKLSKTYGDILKQYYGHDKGVMKVDDLYTTEWAYIPHFYYNFYVYNYTTCYVAATSLANSVMNGEAGAKEKYLDMLSKGSSNDPVTLLREGGVDMTTTKPYEVVRDQMNEIMDEIEEILKEEAVKKAK